MAGEMTPEQRRMRATAAAHASWANTADREARMTPARKGLRSRFEREVDPDGTMDPAERAQRADSARKAYFARLSYRSARVRAERKAAAQDRAAADTAQKPA